MDFLFDSSMINFDHPNDPLGDLEKLVSDSGIKMREEGFQSLEEDKELDFQREIKNNKETANISDSLPSSKDISIEEKRRRGKIRSKRSRDKKKLYYQDLENRIKELQKENFRLQNLVANYRSEKLEYYGKEVKSFVKDSRDIKLKMFKNFVDPETMEMKKKADFVLKDKFNELSKVQLEKHKKFMDEVFKLIVNNICPFDKFLRKRNDTEYTTDYETIKELAKIPEGLRAKVAQEKNLTQVDLLFAAFNPSKRQFEFITKVFMKKDQHLRQKYKEGLKLLFEAKSVIQKTSVELCSYMYFTLNSQAFKDTQIFNSHARRDILQPADLFNEIWKVQVNPVEYKFDLHKDPICGKRARKVFTEDIKNYSFEYNEYSLA
ncbi:unnamed protein product [Moneuplotes crassus]|uniref:BZIP domain-containing protein n=1 Tax=Euplotes crassus TaxID=5936 RepID=A0AAD1XC56_EUPCR|nr:unnamed protein product [Moneuplotes crassus]